MRDTLFLILTVLLLAGGSMVIDAFGEELAITMTGEQQFAVRVQPLLGAKCLPCHGGDKEDIRGGLDLTSRDGTLRGGETSDEVLVPGNADKSLLYRAVTWNEAGYEMPPKENDRLTEEQTWWFRDWINAGAPWPNADDVERIVRAYEAEHSRGVRVATSGGQSAAWDQRLYQPEDLWAYQPLREPRVPWPAAGKQPDANPVDAFICDQLQQIELEPAPRADRRTLLRRATFDLTGLPPTMEHLEEFLKDPAPDSVAFARVVERLLDSPQYGEQWARHWLDVVRYADTAGFANDYERPNAWRYRDYVIRAFNDDKPYDQFVREQIAGDEIDAQNPEMLIAVGFLRMGPWEQTGMSVASITRQQFLDDVTDSVGQVFLSHPLQCCRCHDHKFDPLPTRDYYRLQAVFATTQFAERKAAFLDGENRDDGEGERAVLERRIARYEKVLADLRDKEEKAARRWYAERGLSYTPRAQRLKKGLPEDQIAPRHIGLSTQDFGLERVARKNLTRHRWELDRYQPLAFSVYDGLTPTLRNVQSRLLVPRDRLRGTRRETAILPGGDPFSPGERVQPGGLSCLGPLAEDAAEANHALPNTIEGRRLGLANWLARPENPLVVRSIVNRVWQYHFGHGLARNPNNFGAMGKKPTHPRLLDWLAVTLVREGWSLKTLHRRIMLSDAYCRGPHHPDRARLDALDPDRVTYATFEPRRLSAEEIRDSMLAVSGELNDVMGGIPIRPDLNLEAALQPRQIMGTYAPAYQPSPRPEQRNRRSIYALKIRGLRDPFMDVFNQPTPETSCERREVSTVTPQVFALFNSEETYERALAFAVRLLADSASREDAVRRAFLLAFGRSPAEDEQGACLAHWQHMSERHQGLSLTRTAFPREIERKAVEEMSGEPFTFTEQLEVYEAYVPDVSACEVDVDTRGLAELCLVLLNSNEFLYVY